MTEMSKRIQDRSQLRDVHVMRSNVERESWAWLWTAQETEGHRDDGLIVYVKTEAEAVVET